MLALESSLNIETFAEEMNMQIIFSIIIVSQLVNAGKY